MDDPFATAPRYNPPPPLVAVAGWLIPGAGYWLIGQHARAKIVFVGIVLLYVLGLLVAGVRVIEVPGYDAGGNQVRIIGNRLVRPEDSGYEAAGWALTSGAFVS